MRSTPCLRAEALSEAGLKLFDVGELWLRLSNVTDRRCRKGRRYCLVDVLMVIVLAKLAGRDYPEEIADWVTDRTSELCELLMLPWGRAPHSNTIRRIIERAVEPTELDRAVGEFLSERAHLRASRGKQQRVVVAIDGKTLRGTISQDRPSGEHLLAAYLPEEGVVLMQVRAGGHDNEISAAPKLLGCLDLRDKVVIGDAMHTQRQLSVQILAGGGEYVWVAKDNQPRLLHEIRELFEDDWRGVAGEWIPNDFERYQTIDKGHGRLDRRQITVSSELKAYTNWPGLDQVFRIRRERTELARNQTTVQIVYGLTSLTRQEASPAALLALARQYWQIENGLHRRRDVTFREDSCRATRKAAGHVLASINNLALGLLHHHPSGNIAKARRAFDAHLTRILNQQPPARSLT